MLQYIRKNSIVILLVSCFLQIVAIIKYAWWASWIYGLGYVFLCWFYPNIFNMLIVYVRDWSLIAREGGGLRM